MADVEISFQHPTRDRLQRAKADDGLTAEELIQDLVLEGFLLPTISGYQLQIKNGDLIQPHQSLKDAGVSGGAILSIVPVAEAGGQAFDEDYVGIPGVRKSAGDRLTLYDIQKSPAAVMMLAHMLEKLQSRYDQQARILEHERLRSSSRFTAALLLLVSQVVLAIGANLLTQQKTIAIFVLVAGGLQALLALYLTFRGSKAKKVTGTGRNEG